MKSLEKVHWQQYHSYFILKLKYEFYKKNVFDRLYMVGAVTTFLICCSRNLRHQSKDRWSFTSGATVLLCIQSWKIYFVYISVIYMYLTHHNFRQSKLFKAFWAYCDLMPTACRTCNWNGDSTVSCHFVLMSTWREMSLPMECAPVWGLQKKKLCENYQTF